MFSDGPRSKENLDENVERGNWSGKCDFLLSLIGYAIGISAAWRFPYLCYRNGGGAFLVPYFIMLFVCGIPLFLMETALGQFTSLGAISVYKISPIFKGVGYSTLVVCIFLAVYYNVIICYILFYLAMSFTSSLPWNSCDNEWNTPQCTMGYRMMQKEQMTNTSWLPELNVTSAYYGNISSELHSFENMETNDTFNLANMSFSELKTPAHEFFYNYVLDISSGIHEVGGVNWHLALSLLGAWILVYLCLIKGVKSTGKVVYFTATFPYFVLVVFLIRGLTLPGALDGIIFYIYPEWERLKSFKVWGDAAIQVFYSLGPGWGGLITMASFNRFHNNCFREAIAVPVINAFTAVLSGFVVFSVLGYLSHQAKIPIKNVVVGGPGLAFVVYPEAVSLLPIAPLWSCLFFFMLLTLGLDTQFVTIETVVAAIWDELPHYLRERRFLLCTMICVALFLTGFICVTRGGFYIVQLLDWYSAALTVILICIVEALIICWIYGMNNFTRDISFMLNRKLGVWWSFSCKYSVPVVLTAILVMSVVDSVPISFGDYVYPDWANYMGWGIAAISMCIIPVYMVYKFAITPGSLKQRLKTFQRSEDYGPALSQHYYEWKRYCSWKTHDSSVNFEESVKNDGSTQQPEEYSSSLV